MIHGVHEYDGVVSRKGRQTKGRLAECGGVIYGALMWEHGSKTCHVCTLLNRIATVKFDR